MPPSVQWFPCVISIYVWSTSFSCVLGFFIISKYWSNLLLLWRCTPWKCAVCQKILSSVSFYANHFFYAITNDNQIQVCNLRVGVFYNDWIIPLENVKNDDELYCYRARKSIKKTTIILSSFLYQSLCITYD